MLKEILSNLGKATLAGLSVAFLCLVFAFPGAVIFSSGSIDDRVIAFVIGYATAAGVGSTTTTFINLMRRDQP